MSESRTVPSLSALPEPLALLFLFFNVLSLYYTYRINPYSHTLPLSDIPMVCSCQCRQNLLVVDLFYCFLGDRHWVDVVISKTWALRDTIEPQGDIEG